MGLFKVTSRASVQRGHVMFHLKRKIAQRHEIHMLRCPFLCSSGGGKSAGICGLAHARAGRVPRGCAAGWPDGMINAPRAAQFVCSELRGMKIE